MMCRRTLSFFFWAVLYMFHCESVCCCVTVVTRDNALSLSFFHFPKLISTYHFAEKDGRNIHSKKRRVQPYIVSIYDAYIYLYLHLSISISLCLLMFVYGCRKGLTCEHYLLFKIISRTASFFSLSAKGALLYLFLTSEIIVVSLSHIYFY